MKRLFLLIVLLLHSMIVLASNNIATMLGSQPLTFTENKGQWDDRVKYKAEAFGGFTYFFEQDGLTLVSTIQDTTQQPLAYPMDDLTGREFGQKRYPTKAHALKLSFVRDEKASAPGEKGTPPTKLLAMNEQAWHNNYFLGNDSKRWAPDCRNYTFLEYENVWKGINVVYKGDQKRMKYDIIVKPGASPEQIRFRYDGLTNPLSTQGNQLYLPTSLGSIQEELPECYQYQNGVRRTIRAVFQVIDNDEFTFEFPDGYDTTKELYIDPLVYSTYLGGSADDYVYGISVDSQNRSTIIGSTTSENYPTTVGILDPTYNYNIDVVVSSFDQTGSSLRFSTYIGGSNSDEGNAIIDDGYGGFAIAGRTYSSDFPTTLGSFDTSYNGVYDAFVLRLNSTCSEVLFSTYIGGSEDETCGFGSLVRHPSSGFVLVGSTGSSNFPTTPGAFDQTFNGGLWDTFILHIDNDGSNLVYSTLFGGNGSDYGYGITFGQYANAIFSGDTNSPDLPTTGGAFDTTHNGSNDAFVTSINSSGSSLIYCTYLGGTASDRSYGVTSSIDGDCIVVGITGGANFPISDGAFDVTYNGGYDVFITKMNASGTQIKFSTFLGGSSSDGNPKTVSDGNGGCVVIGFTMSSTSFPITSGAFDPTFNGVRDVYFTHINPTGTALIHSTFIGGDDNDYAYAIDNDAFAGYVIGGYTRSRNYPITPSAFDTTHDSGYNWDAFITHGLFPGICLTKHIADTIRVDHQDTVNWNYHGLTGGVQIDLLHSGSFYRSIGTASVESGRFIWTPSVADTSSSTKIRIFSVEQPQYRDSSLTNSSIIAPSIQVLYPNLSKAFLVNSLDTIQWTSNHVNCDVMIEINRDYPVGEWEIINSNSQNTGLFPWFINAPMTRNSRIRVSSLSDPSIYDDSDSSFTIQRVLLSKPIGGEFLQIGVTDTIRWLSSTLNDSIRIQINYNFPIGDWLDLTNSTYDDGEYGWLVARPSTSNARIRIFPVNSIDEVALSHENFTIYSPIIRPNGGETFIIDEPDTIRWNFPTLTSGIATIKINRSYPNGLWQTIASSVPIAQGYRAWTPTGSLTNTARIAIIPAGANAYLADTSDANFSILPRFIQVTRPNGGEIILTGQPDTIRWNAPYPGTLAIYLSRLGQDYGQLELITDSVYAPTGQYVWTPTGPISDSCYIYIGDILNPVEDWSDNRFRIVNSTITITKPNDGEVFYFGLPDTVKWSSVNLTGNVAIDLRRTVTGDWTNMFPSRPNSGETIWWPTGTSTISAKVRVRSLLEPGTSDTSDFAFSIQNYPWSTLLRYLARNPHALSNPNAAWAPPIPYDIASNNYPPLEVAFPEQVIGHTNPDSVVTSYTAIASDELSINRSINRIWSVAPSNQQFENATLTLRFVQSDLPPTITDPITTNPPLRAVFSEDDESTWIFIPGGTVYRDTASNNSFRFVITGLNHMSEWALTNGGLRPVLTYPNGGETLTIGDSVTFRWTNAIRGGTVSIAINRTYPTGQWETILPNTPNDSLEQWLVSGEVTNNARFRIISEWFASDGDTTNATITIQSAPNPPRAPGNVTITPIGNHMQLQWSRVDSSTTNLPISITGYRIDYRDDVLQTWSPLSTVEPLTTPSYVDSNAVIQTPQRYYQIHALLNTTDAVSTGVRSDTTTSLQKR